MTLYQATYPCGHLIQLCEHSVKNGQPTKKKCPVCHTKKKYPILWCAGCKGREAWKLFSPPLPEPPGTIHIIGAYVIGPDGEKI
jgi:hypothetical protein